MSNNDFISDERLRKDGGARTRGPRSGSDESRVQSDGMSLSSAERRAMIAQEWVQEVLPTPPKIPGWHCVWLSTTNTTDPIYRRLRLGYQPVKMDEVPELAMYKVQGGDFDGGVACSEMVLFKIPDDVYQDIMTVFHHEKPLESELSIKERLMGSEHYDSDGRSLAQVEDGFKQLGRGHPNKASFQI